MNYDTLKTNQNGMEYFSYKKYIPLLISKKKRRSKFDGDAYFSSNSWGVLITSSSNQGKVFKQKSPDKNEQIFLLNAQVNG